jgi:hypothetical protein
MKRIIVVLLGILLVAGILPADKGPNHRIRNPHFGVSGGNVRDITSRYCCSGTLGAMVVGNGISYVLSNNHVLALQDKAIVGDDISQPGLIDNNCRAATTVADFKAAAALGSNVDAAVATLVTGAMAPDGYIEDIGVPSSVPRNPAIGLLVAKSGRTTGYTTGKVSSTSMTVNVSYSTECGSSSSITVRYLNQVAVTGPKFSAGGDSGSLIVTNDINRQPVALLYAGGGNSTIGNPIGEVLTKLGGKLGTALSFTGPARGTATAFVPGAPSDARVEHARNVKNRHEPEIMGKDGVIGLGVGDDEASPGEAFLVVYIDKDKKDPDLPGQIDGVRVKKVKTEKFIAFGCCQACRP